MPRAQAHLGEKKKITKNSYHHPVREEVRSALVSRQEMIQVLRQHAITLHSRPEPEEVVSSFYKGE